MVGRISSISAEESPRNILFFSHLHSSPHHLHALNVHHHHNKLSQVWPKNLNTGAQAKQEAHFQEEAPNPSTC